MTKYTREFIQSLYNRFRDEIDTDLAVLSAMNNYSDPTEQQYLDVVERTVGRHASELYSDALVASGHAANLANIPPAYVQALDARGLTQADIADLSQRMYPQLSKTEAISRWAQAAAKMPQQSYNFKDGFPDGQFYDPGKSRPHEQG